MLEEFERKIGAFIKENELFGPEGGVLLAVSGGADSIALLYVTCALKAEGFLGAEFVVGHINHMLRGAEANGDEEFVQSEATGLNLTVETRRIDVRGYAKENKLSIETAGRRVRIENLTDMARKHKCDVVATAHQKDDNAETVLQRMIRGTGYRGLGGIWPERKFAGGINFVRPMLCVDKDEIIGYLEKRKIKWRVDRTNKDYSFRRNFIRHKLMPYLEKEYGGGLIEELFELSQSAQGFYKQLCGYADVIWPEVAECGESKVTLDVEKFSGQPEQVKIEMIRRSLEKLGSGERDLARGHFERILKLAEQKVSGKKIELPGGFAVGYEYGKLIFERSRSGEVEKQKIDRVEVEIPGETRFGDYWIEAEVLEAEPGVAERIKVDSRLRGNDRGEKVKFVEWFDLDKVKLPLEVRFRREGDRFWPLGLGGEKRVGKFLTAEKVPRQMRQKVLIVADRERIIWVWPVRMAEKAKVTSEMERILQLRITEA